MNLDNKKPGRKPLYVYYIIAAIIIILLNVLLLPAIEGRKVQTTEYSVFLTGVEKGYVKTVEIQDDYIYYVADVSDNQEGYFRTVKVNDPDLVDRLHDANVKFDAAAPQQTSIWISLLAGYILPIAIFILLGRWLSKKMMSSMGGGPGGAMSFGKSNAKVYVKSSTGIKFSDVAGEDEAKDLLTEIVDYLHNPQKYREIGASMPKGALLVGPPGTGKTLLAKAVAGEAEVPFFSISGSEFVEMFVGMGAAKVRDLFKQANEKAPCIVFIDEIDTIGKKRDGAGFTGGNDEREQTLNQLLTEMDGFDGSKGVVILAATNRPDSLDPALLRPGRFDRRIPVELPDLKGREEILKVHAKKIKIADSVRFDEIAKAAAGASGAELANIVNEAALRAVRDGRKFATQADFEESIEVVIAGYRNKYAGGIKMVCVGIDVGDINIGLTETTADYKMVPGNTIAKDPTVTVKANSEACWLFVQVTKSENLDTFITYAIAEGWTALSDVDGVYYREVPASAADQTFSVLAGNAVTVKSDVTRTMLETAKTDAPTLTFQAYAVQKDNVASASDAWAKVNP